MRAYYLRTKVVISSISSMHAYYFFVRTDYGFML